MRHLNPSCQRRASDPSSVAVASGSGGTTATTNAPSGSGTGGGGGGDPSAAVAGPSASSSSAMATASPERPPRPVAPPPPASHSVIRTIRQITSATNQPPRRTNFVSADSGAALLAQVEALHDAETKGPGNLCSALGKVVATLGDVLNDLRNETETANHSQSPEEMALAASDDVESLKRRLLSVERTNRLLNIHLELLNLHKKMEHDVDKKLEDRKSFVTSFREEVYKEIVELLEAEFSCSVCNEIFVSPCVTKCGHTFCQVCIMRWSRENFNCPVCRAVIWSDWQKHCDIENFITRLHLRLSEEIRTQREALVAQRAQDIEQLRRNPNREESSVLDALRILREQRQASRDRELSVRDRIRSLASSRRTQPAPPATEGENPFYVAEPSEASRRRLLVAELERRQTERRAQLRSFVERSNGSRDVPPASATSALLSRIRLRPRGGGPHPSVQLTLLTPASSVITSSGTMGQSTTSAPTQTTNSPMSFTISNDAHTRSTQPLTRAQPVGRQGSQNAEQRDSPLSPVPDNSSNSSDDIIMGTPPPTAPTQTPNISSVISTSRRYQGMALSRSRNTPVPIAIPHSRIPVTTPARPPLCTPVSTPTIHPYFTRRASARNEASSLSSTVSDVINDLIHQRSVNEEPASDGQSEDLAAGRADRIHSILSTLSQELQSGSNANETADLSSIASGQANAPSQVVTLATMDSQRRILDDNDEPTRPTERVDRIEDSNNRDTLYSSLSESGYTANRVRLQNQLRELNEISSPSESTVQIRTELEQQLQRMDEAFFHESWRRNESSDSRREYMFRTIATIRDNAQSRRSRLQNILNHGAERESSTSATVASNPTAATTPPSITNLIDLTELESPPASSTAATNSTSTVSPIVEVDFSASPSRRSRPTRRRSRSPRHTRERRTESSRNPYRCSPRRHNHRDDSNRPFGFTIRIRQGTGTGTEINSSATASSTVTSSPADNTVGLIMECESDTTSSPATPEDDQGQSSIGIGNGMDVEGTNNMHNHDNEMIMERGRDHMEEDDIEIVFPDDSAE